MLKNNRGLTLIETMILMAIMSVAMFVFASQMLQQQKEGAVLKEKLALFSIEQDIFTFANNDICGKQFASNPTLYSTTSLTNTSEFSMTFLNKSSDMATSDVLYEVGKAIGDTKIVVTAMTIKNFVYITTNKYRADLEITLSGGKISYRPFVLPMVITTETLPPNLVLKSCHKYRGNISGAGTSPLAPMNCPTGQYLKGFNNLGNKICIPVPTP